MPGSQVNRLRIREPDKPAENLLGEPGEPAGALAKARWESEQKEQKPRVKEDERTWTAPSILQELDTKPRTCVLFI